MTEITTAEQVRELPTGQKFTAHIGELPWRDAHAIMYHTANKPVEITVLGGTVITGVLDETPGYFGGFKRKVWIRQSGRKTRKGILVADIVSWKGQKSPGLEATLNAFLYLNSPGATEEQLDEAVATVRMM